VWSIEEFEAITAQQRDQLQSADGLKHVPTLEIFMTQYPHIPAFTSMWTAAKAIPSFAKKTILEQFDWLRGEWRAYVKSKAGAVVKAASKLIVPMLAQNFFKIFAEWKPIMEVAGNLTIVMGQLVEAAVDDFNVAHNIAKDAGIPNDNAAEFVDGLSGNMAATLLINLVASHQKVLQQTDRTVELKWHADRHDMVAYMSVLESAAKAIGQLPSAELQFRLPTGDKSARRTTYVSPRSQKASGPTSAANPSAKIKRRANRASCAIAWRSPTAVAESAAWTSHRRASALLNVSTSSTRARTLSTCRASSAPIWSRRRPCTTTGTSVGTTRKGAHIVQSALKSSNRATPTSRYPSVNTDGSGRNRVTQLSL